MTKDEQDFITWMNSQLDVPLDTEEVQSVLHNRINNPALQKFGASIPGILLAGIKRNRTWYPTQGD